MENELETLRARLDEIDGALVSCFVERMETVKKISRVKKSLGASVRDSLRELAVENRVCFLAPKPLKGYVKALYCRVLWLSRHYQNHDTEDEV